MNFSPQEAISQEAKNVDPQKKFEKMDVKDKFQKTIIVDDKKRISTSIPEELILEGKLFNIYSTKNDETNSISDILKHNIEFLDTDNNGIYDTIEWDSMDDTNFMIEAQIDAFSSYDKEEKLDIMKNKIDGGLFNKTISALNSKSTSNFQLPDRQLSSIRSLQDTKSFDDEFHDVIILVDNVDEEGHQSRIISEKNKNRLYDILKNDYSAGSLYKAKSLSFVVAKVPLTELSNVVEHDFVRSIGDGELELKQNLDDTKQQISAEFIEPQDDFIDGFGSIIAVVDNGIFQSHHALPIGTDKKVIKQVYCRDPDLTFPFDIICDESSSPHTDYSDIPGSLGLGHGTAVAGIVGGDGDGGSINLKGIAPGANLYNAKLGFKTAGMIVILDWIVTNGADVVNFSGAYQNPENENDFHCTDSDNSRTISLVADEVVDRGVLFVMAAGNEGEEVKATTIGNPGCAHNVITVGGMIYDGNNPLDTSQWEIDSTSSYGPTFGVFEDKRLKPEIAAPIIANAPNGQDSYFPFGGTSASSPHVAGVAALVKQVNPNYEPVETKASILLGADWPEHRSNLILGVLPFTSKIYEDQPIFDPRIVQMNSWGLGLVNATKSLDFIRNGHIVQNIIVDQNSAGYTPISYTFDVDSDNQGIHKIILTWLKHPFNTVSNPLNEAVSNLDLQLTYPDGTTTVLADSQSQNIEYIFFDATQTGTYTITITATFVDNFIELTLGGEPFALASSISINEANSIPLALNDFVTAEELELITIPVTNNDSDPESNPLTVFSLDDRETNATLATGSDFVTFRSDADFIGNTTFRYTISDGNGGFDIGSVIVNVTESTTLKPTANDDAVITQEGIPVTIDVLVNDDLAEPGSSLSVHSFDNTGTQGTVVINGNPGEDITFTPDPGFTDGTTTFTYIAIDEDQRLSNSAIVTVTVQPIPPGGERLYIGERSTDEIQLFDVTTGASQPDFVTSSRNGGLDMPSDLVYDETNDYLYVSSHDSDEVIRYTATGAFDSVIASSANSLNNPEGLALDSSGNLYIASTQNDLILRFDSNGNPLPATGKSGAIFIDDNNIDEPHGLAFDSSGRLYISNNANSDENVVRYTSQGNFDTEFVGTGQNGLDTPRDITFDSSGNLYVISITPTEVMRFDSSGNASPAPGESGATFVPASDLDDPKTLDFDDSGRLYVADDDLDAILRFDTSGNLIDQFDTGNKPATAHTIGPAPLANVPPIASNDSTFTDEDTLLNDYDILANDIDDDTISLVSISNSAQGVSVTNNGDGTIDYQPPSNFNGQDSFTYTIQDQFGIQDSATVTITVNSINDPPTANNDSTTINEDILLDDFDLLANDDDVDLPADFIVLLSVDLISSQGGIITDNGDGTIDYQSPVDFNGQDTFSYTIQDSFGVQDSATVTITINPVNDAPILTPIGNQTVTEDESLIIPISAFDVDTSDSLSFSQIGVPVFANFVDNLDGTATLTVNPEFGDAGLYPINVTVTDNGTPQLSDSEEFTLEVIGATLVSVSENLGITSDINITSTNIPKSFNVTLVDRMGIAGSLDASLIGVPSQLNVTITENLGVQSDLDPSIIGTPQSFNVTIVDNLGISDSLNTIHTTGPQSFNVTIVDNLGISDSITTSKQGPSLPLEGIISGFVTILPSGGVQLQVNLTDSLGITDTITLNVTNTNLPPVEGQITGFVTILPSGPPLNNEGQISGFVTIIPTAPTLNNEGQVTGFVTILPTTPPLNNEGQVTGFVTILPTGTQLQGQITGQVTIIP